MAVAVARDSERGRARHRLERCRRRVPPARNPNCLMLRLPFATHPVANLRLPLGPRPVALRHCGPGLRLLAAAAALGLAACADSATGPTAATSLAAPHLDKNPVASCDAPTVRALTVTPASLTIVVSESATFTACTQYATDFAVAVAPAGVITVTAAGPAGRVADGLPYKQAFTVTAAAGAAGRTATITVTDKKGATQAVTVTVVPPPVT